MCGQAPHRCSWGAMRYSSAFEPFICMLPHANPGYCGAERCGNLLGRLRQNLKLSRGLLDGIHHDLKIKSLFADALVNIDQCDCDRENRTSKKAGEELADIRPHSR